MTQSAHVVTHVEMQLYRCRWPREARHALLSDDQVTVTCLTEADKGCTVQLSGEAPALANLMAYLQRLRTQQHIDSVRLQHSEWLRAPAAGAVRFSVEARRRPDA